MIGRIKILSLPDILRHPRIRRLRYDLIIIDCQPSLGLLTVNALTAAQAQKRYPYPMDDLGLDNIGQILQTDNGFLIQKGDKLYWIDLNGNSHPIDLGSTAAGTAPLN